MYGCIHGILLENAILLYEVVSNVQYLYGGLKNVIFCMWNLENSIFCMSWYPKLKNIYLYQME